MLYSLTDPSGQTNPCSVGFLTLFRKLSTCSNLKESFCDVKKGFPRTTGGRDYCTGARGDMPNMYIAQYVTCLKMQ